MYSMLSVNRIFAATLSQRLFSSNMALQAPTVAVVSVVCCDDCVVCCDAVSVCCIVVCCGECNVL